MDINRYSPSYGLSQKHLIKISDFTNDEIFEFLYAIKVMKGKFIAHENTRILNGVTIALLFGDTSLRTRSALEIGVRQLGGTCINLPYSREDMTAGENIGDIISVIARYGVGALVTREISQSELENFCADSEIPIINSINDYGAPLQALCDMYTIWEKRGVLEGLKFAYVGKATGNAASVITAAVKCGMEVSVATPSAFPLNEHCLDIAMQYGNVNVTENPSQAVKDADILYTDNYNYHSPISEEERAILAPYKINKSLASLAAYNAMFMHPLPANRGTEVTADVIDGKYSLVLEQGENKLHAVKAVLAMLIK